MPKSLKQKRKRWGQHLFVNIPRFVIPGSRELKALVPPGQKLYVIEIGPGLGALSKPLLTNLRAAEIDYHYSLIEIDPDFYLKLKSWLDKEVPQNTTLLNKDFMQFRLSKFLKKIPKKSTVLFFSALPYSSSKKIMRKVVSESAPFTRTGKLDIHCRFVMQQEVAKNYIRKPPRQDFIGVWLSLYTKEVKMSSIIKPGCFQPPPKVNSRMIQFKILETGSWLKLTETETLEPFLEFVKSLFQQKRKTLRKTLKRHKQYKKQFANLKPEDNPLKPYLDKRPQELDVKGFFKIFKYLSSQSPDLAK